MVDKVVIIVRSTVVLIILTASTGSMDKYIVVGPVVGWDENRTLVCHVKSGPPFLVPPVHVGYL